MIASVASIARDEKIRELLDTQASGRTDRADGKHVCPARACNQNEVGAMLLGVVSIWRKQARSWRFSSALGYSRVAYPTCMHTLRLSIIQEALMVRGHGLFHCFYVTSLYGAFNG